MRPLIADEAGLKNAGRISFSSPATGKVDGG
jgi:hypothetical protein